MLTKKYIYIATTQLCIIDLLKGISYDTFLSLSLSPYIYPHFNKKTCSLKITKWRKKITSGAKITKWCITIGKKY